jgi:hypothetical protein
MAPQCCGASAGAPEFHHRRYNYSAHRGIDSGTISAGIIEKK